MPSAFPCRRTSEEDLRALDVYSRYRYASKNDRAMAKMAFKDLKHYFSRYWRNFQEPGRLLPNRALRQLSAFLFRLYGSDAEPFRYIENLRNLEELGVCLYCGLPKNFTVDHYLPRDVSAFPHFSFLSPNLIPACSSCQGSKGSFYPKGRRGSRRPAKGVLRARALRTKANGNTVNVSRRKSRVARLRSIAVGRKKAFFQIRETRRIIHPYFDRFLSRPAFDLNISWHQEVPQIEGFLWRPYLSIQQRALLSFHMGKLKVQDRSGAYVRRAHKAFADSVVGEGLNEDQIRERIDFMITNSRKKSGVENSIEASYFRALRQDRSRHAVLAAKSSDNKQQLVPEAKAKAVSSRTRGYDAKMFGY